VTDDVYAGTWQAHPDAEQYLHELYRAFGERMPLVTELEERALEAASCRLVDLIDAVVLSQSEDVVTRLERLGYREQARRCEPGRTCWGHPGAILPDLLLQEDAGGETRIPLAVRLRVASIAKLQMTLGCSAVIDGAPLAPYRRAQMAELGGQSLEAVERRYTRDHLVSETAAVSAEAYLTAFDAWACRPRRWDDLDAGLSATQELAEDLVSQVGPDAAAWIAFAAERVYWQQRNLTGRIQRRRQDALGLGWANHDHHTFRSSRRAFARLIRLLETFGFECREQFYAGAEAGWGAQVLEHPTCGIVIFADVDLAPEEVSGDFAHRELEPKNELGTVGLWCALHGESLLDAGLHHLAARFDFDRFREDITREGRGMLAPFSDRPILRQAFSQGERWPLPEDRLQRLANDGIVSAQQVERFRTAGAMGSHIENIQRGEGFKGFSQSSVSDIIRRTDPRGENA